jgi:hypothetical protein
MAERNCVTLRELIKIGEFGNVYLIHKTADMGFISASCLSMLTEKGRETYAALLDATVVEIRNGAYGVEFVIDDVDPQILGDIDQAAADHLCAEHAMGDMQP